MADKRLNLKNRVLIPFEAYFPETHGCILRDVKPWNEYADDPVTKEKKPTGKQLGISVVVISPYMAFEAITVKIAGDMGDTLDYPDIGESFTTGNYIYVNFDNFAGGSYTMNGVTHYTGTASAVKIAEAPQAAVLSKKPAAAGKTKAANANPFNT
jgi:hypothetical protein